VTVNQTETCFETLSSE